MKNYSNPECTASERRASDPVQTPTAAFATVKKRAAPTETRATRNFSIAAFERDFPSYSASSQKILFPFGIFQHELLALFLVPYVKWIDISYPIHEIIPA